MKVELITKEDALQKYNELRELAYAIASANNCLPGECKSPECILFMDCAELAVFLKTGDICIFINEAPAVQISEVEIAPGQLLICKICARNVQSATLDDNALFISYHDGVVEEYSFVEDLHAWKFEKKNISVNVPSTSAN